MPKGNRCDISLKGIDCLILYPRGKEISNHVYRGRSGIGIPGATPDNKSVPVRVVDFPRGGSPACEHDVDSLELSPLSLQPTSLRVVMIEW
jgi:hypothetical protein